MCIKSLQNCAVLEGRVYPMYPHAPRGIKASCTSCRHTVKTCSINGRVDQHSGSLLRQAMRGVTGHKGASILKVFTNQRKKNTLRYVHYLCNHQRLHFCKYREMKIQTLEWLHLAGCVQARRLLVKRRQIWEGIQPQIMTLKRYRQQYSETSRNIPWRSKEGQVQSDHRVSPGVGTEGLEAATQSTASAAPGQSVRKVPGKPFSAPVRRDGREKAGAAADSADGTCRARLGQPAKSPCRPRAAAALRARPAASTSPSQSKTDPFAHPISRSPSHTHTQL